MKESFGIFHRYRMIWIILLFLIQVNCTRNFDHIPPWMVSLPASFVQNMAVKGKMLDVRSSLDDMSFQKEVSNINLEKIDGYTDGEMVDALEHFFWGLKNGLALELGAADGSAGTRSMTVVLQESLGWERILIEGNSEYRQDLVGYSPEAVVINAAICKNSSQVHFISAHNGGGILEFMSKEYLQHHHPNIYEAGTPNGDLHHIKWPFFPTVKELKCLTLAKVTHFLRLKYINFFVLDVAGAELEALRSIHWKYVRFDVLCIKTDPQWRPIGFAEKIVDFLRPFGYINYAGQVGRNIWFIHEKFRPSSRPGLAKKCFNGYRKSEYISSLSTPSSPSATAITISTLSSNNSSSSSPTFQRCEMLDDT